MKAKTLLGVILGAAAGLAATTAALVSLGNRRVDKWETLTQDDAADGDFVTLRDGTRMHYIKRDSATVGQSPAVSGQPSAVILIHGLMDSSEQWRANIDALAHTRRVWAIDLIGFGFSSRVTTPTYSMKMFARALRDFMDAQGIARASIVGHSLGGAIALEFAHDFPARVEKLVLIAPATYLLQFRPELKMAQHLPFVPRALIGWTMTHRRARERALRDALGDPAHFDPEELARRTRPMRVRGTADALVAMLGSPHGSDLPQDLARVTAPTLIVWGEKDRAVPVRHGAYHTRALPNAKLVIVENAGHIPQYEYPDKVNELLLRFLDQSD
ncbi:MAG: alpha/beta fold hydrolase [Chloroflexi bacterium]|nr:alpha/beta fold hydrolase [Chloroflexota bacterium]